MSISSKLCEVRDRDFGGSQKEMAKVWDINQSTLSRWLTDRRVPDSAWYGFLAEKLGMSILDVHQLCMVGKTGRELAISA